MIATPFQSGELDRSCLAEFVECQIAEGVCAISPCTIVGEVSTLSPAEKVEIIRICVAAAGGKLPVIPGTGTNCTASTIVEMKQARDLGADAVLVTVPYYSKPSQPGIIHHFEMLSRSVNIPIIIENRPSHTVVGLTAQTFEHLAGLPGIVGVVDASGNFASGAPASRSAVGLPVFSGVDDTATGFVLGGGRGAWSSLANVMPGLVCSHYHAARTGAVATAIKLHERLAPLLSAINLEPHPATIKHALSILEGFDAEVRLPLTTVEQTTAYHIERVIAGLPDNLRRQQAHVCF
jgi:4-hydroxy-tetrahydrodipicolinate synthase